MTPTQFKKTLAGLALEKNDEAAFFCVDRVSVWRWINGKRKIPKWAIKMLTGVASGNKVDGKKGR